MLGVVRILTINKKYLFINSLARAYCFAFVCILIFIPFFSVGFCRGVKFSFVVFRG